eukprot:354470-Chlamydomonas_euryale.AAC.1
MSDDVRMMPEQGAWCTHACANVACTTRHLPPTARPGVRRAQPQRMPSPKMICCAKSKAAGSLSEA